MSRFSGEIVKVTYFGHACLLFEWADARLLCDPWTDDHGAFHAAWFQFPETTEVARTVPRDPTHLYISHEHQDHFDPTFLKGLSRDTEILISDHPSPWVRRGLTRLGLTKIREMPSEQKMKIDGAELAVITSDDPGTPDSALWIEQGGTRYFNQNDCEFTGPFLEGLRERFPADVHFVQYAPANWFPMVYDYPREQKMAIYPKRRESRLNKFVNYVAGMRAKRIVGFAGPAAFLDTGFLEACLPAGGIMPTFADPEKALRVRGLRQPVHVPLPGDRLDSGGRIVENGPYDDWKDDDASRDSYLRSFAKRKGPKIAEELASLPPAAPGFASLLASHLESIAKRAPFLAAKLNAVVRFEMNDLGEQVTLDATRSAATVRADAHGRANYTIRTQSRFLRPLVEGKWNWDWFLLSMRFTAHREPDEYNPWLQYFLSRSTPREARLIENFLQQGSPEMITVEAAGSNYEIERWCPHAMGDLNNATIDGKTIQCAVHHMRFDLETGACNGQGVRNLRTRRL